MVEKRSETRGGLSYTLAVRTKEIYFLKVDFESTQFKINFSN